ncbi:MAG: DUF6361 family protein [Bacteroides sp.]|nr:DUF6361 family protein [Bacteroides sp.]MCM1471406.1 DUF6361 family protein [Bacteroides sp.]
MKLLQDQGAIDELGLGRIRDAFSNTMFPGLSVLQTRAKYFCLLPALYSYLERRQISDARDARKKILKAEKSITLRLAAGSTGETGIIGAESLSQGREYVKYDPTYVYMAGLETYGLVKTGGNIYATLAERSAAYAHAPKKHSGTDDTGDDSDDQNGFWQLFLKFGVDYHFDSDEKLTMTLNNDEASFLKSQIIRHTKGSLLHHLLDSGLFEKVTETQLDFEALGEILKGNVPEPIWNSYRLALRYSRYADLLRTRFAYLYNKAVGADDAANDELAEFDRKLEEYSNEFTPEAIGEIVRFVDHLVNDDGSKQFVIKTAKAIADGDDGALDELIKMREKTIKGIRRSKLLNAKEYEQGNRFAKPAPMSYRWNTIGHTVLKDISDGLNHIKERS